MATTSTRTRVPTPSSIPTRTVSKTRNKPRAQLASKTPGHRAGRFRLAQLVRHDGALRRTRVATHSPLAPPWMNAMNWLFQGVVERLVRIGNLTITDPDATEHTSGDGTGEPLAIGLRT